MDLQISTGNVISIISLEGRLDVFQTASVEKSIMEIIESSNAGNVILNLEKLDYLGSSGLRIFISIKRKLEKDGGELMLCSRNNGAVNLFFKIVNCQEMFRIYPTVDEALAHLSKSTVARNVFSARIAS